MARRTPILLCVASLAAIASVGCDSTSATSRPLTFSERQDQAIKDPMNYKPDFSNDNVTSGGIGDFDQKGFNRDVQHVFNP